MSEQRAAKNINELLADALIQLSERVANPQQEARALLAQVLQTSMAGLHTSSAPSAEQATRFSELVGRRRAGERLQHLSGVAGFRYVEVAVGPGVFVPRPETEVMTGWVIEHLEQLHRAGIARPLVLEPCTGSGAISKAIATEASFARVIACEVSEIAFNYAAKNLIDTDVEVRLGDLESAFADVGDGSVDVVVCNPPYIPYDSWESVEQEVRDHDPHVALFSGADGLDAMRSLADLAVRVLRRGGVVAAEHAEVQHLSAQRVFLATGTFDHVRDHRDLTERPRFVTARAIGLADSDL